MTSSSSPASANWPARSPPPTIHTFLPAAARTISACTGAYVATHEPEVGVRHGSQLPVREDPAGDVVGPLPVGRILVRELVTEDPLVCRRPHRQRADACEELRVVQEAAMVLVAREQPVERVARVGDVAVERGRRVVLRESHAATRSSAWRRVTGPVCRTARARSTRRHPGKLPVRCSSSDRTASCATRTCRPPPRTRVSARTSARSAPRVSRTFFTTCAPTAEAAFSLGRSGQRGRGGRPRVSSTTHRAHGAATRPTAARRSRNSSRPSATSRRASASSTVGASAGVAEARLPLRQQRFDPVPQIGWHLLLLCSHRCPVRRRQGRGVRGQGRIPHGPPSHVCHG